MHRYLVLMLVFLVVAIAIMVMTLKEPFVRNKKGSYSPLVWLTALLAIISTALFAFFAYKWIDYSPPVSHDTHVSASPTATPSSSASPEQTTVTSPDPHMTAQQLADQLAKVFKGGYVLGGPAPTLRVGSQVTTTGHTPVRGVNSFSKKTLTTPKEVGEFLQSDDAKAKQARDRVVSSLKAAGYGQAEIDRALSGDGYFAVQMTVPSQIMGTSYVVNGRTYVAADWRTVPAEDILWLFATTDGKIVYGASVRADCANPNLTQVRLITPSTPQAPPVSCASPNSPGCQPTHCVCPTPTPSPACTSSHSCPSPTPSPSKSPPCRCVTPTQVSQPVYDTAAPVPQYTHVPTNRTAQPSPPPSAPPGVAPSSPAPSGYSNGGGNTSGTAPGGTHCGSSSCTGGGQPSPSGPADSPYPQPSSPNSGNPGPP